MLDPGHTADQAVGKSEYELQREANIRRNEAALATLGVHAAKIKAETKPRRASNAKKRAAQQQQQEDDVPPLRRSTRGRSGAADPRSFAVEAENQPAKRQRRRRAESSGASAVDPSPTTPASTEAKRPGGRGSSRGSLNFKMLYKGKRYTRADSVCDTGADAGAIVVGHGKLNHGLRIRVAEAQETPSPMLANLSGKLELLDAGEADGKYTEYKHFFRAFVGGGVLSAAEILADKRKPAKLTYTFVRCGFHVE